MAQPLQPQQPIRYPQYGSTVNFKNTGDSGKKIAIAAIVLGVLGVLWGLFGTPQSKVSPDLELLAPNESRLVTIICSPCDIGAAKAVVGDENYLGSPAQDRLIVRATGAHISQMGSLDWVKYITR